MMKYITALCLRYINRIHHSHNTGHSLNGAVIPIIKLSLNNMKNNCAKSILICCVLMFVASQQIFSQTSAWTETQPAGNTDLPWYTISMSSDGTKILAGQYDGYLYYSSNSGIGWVVVFPCGAGLMMNWMTTSMSADGTKMIAGVYGGRIYMSLNGGSSWFETQPAGNNNKNWKTISMSADGMTIVAGVYGGELYYTYNGAENWFATNGLGNKNWQTTAVDSNGSMIIAGVHGGRLYISNDKGINFTETTDIPKGATNRNWVTTSISSDGSTMIAGVDGGRLYMTSNSASWWWETMPAGSNNKSWRTTSMSSDGLKVIAGVYGGRLYYTDNQSVNWTEIEPAGNNDKNWQAVSMSSDATKIIAGVYGGRLYLNALPLPVILTWTETQPAGNNNKNWRITSANSDGSVIIAGVSGNGRLYISRNSGAGWNETCYDWGFGCYDDYYWLSSINTDGTKMIVGEGGETGGSVFMSTNTGYDWYLSQPDPDFTKATWLPSAMTPDGNVTVAGINGNDVQWGGGMYKTTNNGTSWIDMQPAGNTRQFWSTFSMSSDGTKMLAGANGGKLYISQNGGINWAETGPLIGQNESWYFSSMSSSGNITIAGVHGGRLYITRNGGTSWDETYPPGGTPRVNLNWMTASMTSDGSIIIAGVYGGRLYVSTDSGNNWFETQPAGSASPNRNWMTVSISADGSKLIAGESSGRLYINDIPLPVSLSSFSAVTLGNTVVLKWKTSSETNNAGFFIEKSECGIQNSEWKNVGFVKGKGTTGIPTNYTFEDKKLPTGKYKYRLRQIDYNGNFEYHNLSGEVEVGVPTKYEMSQNYPNPFNPMTKIDFQLPMDGKVSLKIYDITGREIATLVNNEFKKADYYTVMFNGSSLSSGVYFYRITADKYVMTKKMVLLK